MIITEKKAAIEKKLAELEKQLKSIENSAAFKKENTVRRALANLMKKHDCSKNELITLLQGNESKPVKRSNKSTANSRKPRKLKVFKNPETGQTVETRGGNHKPSRTTR